MSEEATNHSYLDTSRLVSRVLPLRHLYFGTDCHEELMNKFSKEISNEYVIIQELTLMLADCAQNRRVCDIHRSRQRRLEHHRGTFRLSKNRTL